MKRTWAFLFAAVLSLMSTWAMATPVLISGTLSLTDPTFNRPLSGNPPSGLSGVGTAVRYDVYQFSVSLNASYVLETTAAVLNTSPANDTFIVLYANAFNPLTPLVNAIAADDDSASAPSVGLSRITRNLTAGTNYFFVVTTFSNDVTGSYSARLDSAAGVGQVTLAVPEPSTLALAALAFAGLAATRRRSQAR